MQLKLKGIRPPKHSYDTSKLIADLKEYPYNDKDKFIISWEDGYWYAASTSGGSVSKEDTFYTFKEVCKFLRRRPETIAKHYYKWLKVVLAVKENQKLEKWNNAVRGVEYIIEIDDRHYFLEAGHLYLNDELIHTTKPYIFVTGEVIEYVRELLQSLDISPYRIWTSTVRNHYSHTPRLIEVFRYVSGLTNVLPDRWEECDYQTILDYLKNLFYTYYLAEENNEV